MVTAAELLSVAAFDEGKYAQAFPSFGSERMGSPVMAFCRISSKPIRSREPVIHPHALIVQDATLLHQAGLFQGLEPHGFVLINSNQDLASLGLAEFLLDFDPARCRTVPATELAVRYVKRPVPNAALLGGFCAITGQLKLESVTRAIQERFPGAIGEANGAAAEAAYDLVREAVHA